MYLLDSQIKALWMTRLLALVDQQLFSRRRRRPHPRRPHPRRPLCLIAKTKSSYC